MMDDEFKALFRRYYANLKFYATRLVGGDDAEDIVQEVFVDLWHRREMVVVGDQIQAFLYRAVYTRALNVLKHRDVVGEYETLMADIGRERAAYYAPDNNEIISRIENQELRQRLTEAISELPEKCQMVFKLSYLHDMKNKQIADIMGVSLRTVEAHMYKALKILRDKLGGVNELLLLILAACTKYFS